MMSEYAELSIQKKHEDREVKAVQYIQRVS